MTKVMIVSDSQTAEDRWIKGEPISEAVLQ
jgi:hypothetical protein